MQFVTFNLRLAITGVVYDACKEISVLQRCQPVDILDLPNRTRSKKVLRRCGVDSYVY
jgi:hypothetical protein